MRGLELLAAGAREIKLPNGTTLTNEPGQGIRVSVPGVITTSFVMEDNAVFWAEVYSGHYDAHTYPSKEWERVR